MGTVGPSNSAPAVLPFPTIQFNPLDPEIKKKLDPAFVEYYEQKIDIKPATHQIPLKQVRDNPKNFIPPWQVKALPYVRIFDSELIDLSGWRVPIRIYEPNLEKFGLGPYGVHINFHGGGFVFGSLATDTKACGEIQENVGLKVIDVDYRLCPENEFGWGIFDGWNVVKYVHHNAKDFNIKADSISIGGVSSGGHIAAVIQHKCRDKGIHLRLALLTTPMCTYFAGYKTPEESPHKSFYEFSRGAMLNWERLKYFASNMFGTEEEKKRIVKDVEWFWIEPLGAKSFAGLCDTFIATAECDPVRDEGGAYGMKAIEAGVTVTVKRYAGMPHAFNYMDDILQPAKQYKLDMLGALKIAHELV